MPSAINPDIPMFGGASTQRMRDNFNVAKSEIEQLQFVSFPGRVSMYAGSTPPTGYLLCNGAAVSRTTYSALFALYGETFGAGDGSTTFNLPDFRGRFPVGAGGTYADGDTGGEDSVVLTTATMGTHDHGDTGTAGDHTHTGGSVGTHQHTLDVGSAGSHTHTVTLSAAGAHAHNVEMPKRADNVGGNIALFTDTSATGGFTETSSTAGDHTHSYTTASTGSHTHSISTGGAGGHTHTTPSAPAHTHTVASVGSGDPHENRPPFLAVNFIVRAF